MKFFLISVIFGICILFSGCSLKMGSFSEQTHFTYPNSNVKPLGYVKAALSKTSYFIPPAITNEDVTNLMNDALAQKSGADLIINYRVNTINTCYPFDVMPIFWKTDIILEGTAVNMEVGIQELQETVEKSKYKY